MLKIIVALFLVTEANGWSNYEWSNDHPCEKLRCESPYEPKGFPENNEELQEICNPVIQWIECQLRYEECYNGDPEGIQVGYRIHGVVTDICSEDTLLHAAVVNNLKCAREQIVSMERRLCVMHGVSPDRIELFVEALSEEGLVSLTENENETHRLHRCIERVNYAICNALQLERECGTIAMNAYVEIQQRSKPGAEVIGCDDAFDFLPALIRLQKLEEKKEHDIAEIFRKKK